VQPSQTSDTRINVRLSGEDAENFQYLLKQSGESVSNVVRAALHAYGARQLSPAPNPARLLDNFVAAGEGPEDLSVNTKCSHEYDEYLQRKVELARASMRSGRGKSNDEVEATFAAMRQRLAAGQA